MAKSAPTSASCMHQEGACLSCSGLLGKSRGRKGLQNAMTTLATCMFWCWGMVSLEDTLTDCQGLHMQRHRGSHSTVCFTALDKRLTHPDSTNAVRGDATAGKQTRRVRQARGPSLNYVPLLFS
jgi:hypothetical protein